MYFEPQYAFGRNFLTKIITLSSILDDMYDAYATLDELEIFTAAIERYTFFLSFFILFLR